MPKFDVASPFLREAQRLQAIQKGTAQAIGRATSTLVRRLPVEARRDIQQEYNLPARRINDALSASKDDTSVTLTGKARGVGLIEFGGQWRGRKSEGASAKVFTGGAGHVYGGTFIAVGLNGNRQIFDRKRGASKRRMTKGGYIGQLKQPLKSLYGPSVASMLRKGDRESRLADFAQSLLSVEIDRLLQLTSP
jgi:hypothetical protein